MAPSLFKKSSKQEQLFQETKFLLPGLQASGERFYFRFYLYNHTQVRKVGDFSLRFLFNFKADLSHIHFNRLR